MKTSLVLSGGGAKGAYEAGAIKALKELGYDFDIAVGTSIGALNALLVAQEDYQELYDLWDNLTLEKVLATPITFNLDGVLNQTNLIKPFFKSYLNEKGADITPLLNLIHSLYDDKKAFKSKTTFGVCTVMFPSLKPVQISIHDMKKNEPVEYAIASASCFPAFPIQYIDDQGYIDGGYYDNLPVNLAFKLGAKQCIAIELNQDPTHEFLLDKPNIVFIRPSYNLEGFLDFDRELLDWRIKLGYNDVYKQLGDYFGYRYTFKPNSFNNDLAQKFYELVLLDELSFNDSLINNKMNNSSNPIGDQLKNDTYINHLKLDDYLIRAVEIAMESKLKYSNVEVYDFDQVLHELYNDFLNYDEDVDLSNVSNFANYKLVQKIYDNLTNNKEDILKTTGMLFKNYIEGLLYYTISREGKK